MISETSAAAPPLGLFQRAIGVIASPSATFQAVIARPRPAGVLFLVCVAMALATGGPQLTERGREAALANQVTQIERFTGQPVSPEQYSQMRQGAPVAAYVSMGAMFVGVPFMTVLFSALYWAFFNIILNGNATFGQVLAVTAHSQVISALGLVVGAPIQILQGTFDQVGPFNLGVLAPMLDPSSGPALFLGAVTFFGIWQAVVAGIGLGVLYRRRPLGVIIALLLIYLGTTALFTVGLSSVTGGN